MKEKNKENKRFTIHKQDNALSRKDALKKIGLSAFSAATMMILLNNNARGQYESPPIPPDW